MFDILYSGCWARWPGSPVAMGDGGRSGATFTIVILILLLLLLLLASSAKVMPLSWLDVMNLSWREVFARAGSES